MKTTIEYPATHSMSTAWYIVDDDGNVGILDYNENGPVPNGLAEHVVAELVWGLCDNNKKYKQIPIKLTIDQIYENISERHSPDDEDFWSDLIVKIKVDKTERFRQLCNHKDIYKCICVSEDEGLYIFDAMYSFDYEHDKVIEGSPLEALLKEGIIESVYRLNEFGHDDTFKQGYEKPVHTKNYDSCSFFLYHQPYWEDYLPEKMSSPKNPVNIDQLPDEIKSQILHIPGNFEKLDTFQIAELYPSSTTYCMADPLFLIDGYEYNLLPLPDGTKAYLLSEEAAVTDDRKIKYTIEEFEELCKLGRAEKKNRLND
ncbi:MAG: hypothetical protein MJZ33_00965 [Paludibacteraceae bacterium]|nr:hypothetical protein [Paludibacteraceae bacterium]